MAKAWIALGVLFGFIALILIAVAIGQKLVPQFASDQIPFLEQGAILTAVVSGLGGLFLGVLNAAHNFYEKHGGITIILARFMPFIRTFAPFVAGVAEMNRATFTAYNVVGALIWVVGLTTVGYLFGNLPFVQQHLSKIIWALILIPGLIALFGAWKASRQERTAA